MVEVLCKATCFSNLTSGTEAYLVRQVIPACSSTPYPDVGETKDKQGCHHLLPTPQPWDTRQTRVTSNLNTTSTLLATTLALHRSSRQPARGPLLEYLPRDRQRTRKIIRTR